ncbi:MAG: succinate-semialdehyde dehydrogenase / glutarate-semialdehyde dehydrogenase [Gaiellales bacterium]|nr:succinate-semialdehyde dehydrogenase / glutarate-semialdehyde dehydrogenase [Gaiellales bacterium]
MATIAKSEYQMPIGGEWVESEGGRFDVTNPATGEVVGSAVNATADDVRRAIDAADAALGPWKALAALERARILRKASERILAEADLIAGVMTDEQGKPLAEARGEVVYAASFLEWFAGEAERVYGMTLPPMNPNKRVLVLRQPVGVTAAITPWNFPAAMMTRKLGPALAAGCTMIVKPASATPLTALEVVRCMEEAGVPAGVVNVVTSRRTADVANTLFSDPRVRKISFTGSTEVGKELIRASADQVKRLSLELGGHAPFVIFEDADMKAAVADTMASKYRNAGQTCVCANRIYVQRSIHGEFVKELARQAGAMKVGNGRDEGVAIGPLIDARGVAKADEHVQDAIAKGADLVVGGEALTDGAYAAGSFYAPTVLDNVTEDMLIYREETFGPVAGVTVFDTEDEAIRMANDTIYGLAAYFHTRDYARLLRVAERLEYGIVGANDGIISSAAAPFGGIKESGYGREGGPQGIEEYLDVKYVSIGGVGSL